jgi:hypothetical protein
MATRMATEIITVTFTTLNAQKHLHGYPNEKAMEPGNRQLVELGLLDELISIASAQRRLG